MLRHELKRFYSKVDGSQACKKSNLKCHTMITVQIWGDLPSRVTLRSGNFTLSTLIFQLYIVYLQKVLWCHLNNERNYLQQWTVSSECNMFHCDAGEPQLLGRNYFGRQLQCRRGFTLCKVQCTAFMPMYALNVAFSVFLCQAEYAAACPALLLFTTLRHCSSSVSWKRLSGKNPSEFK